MFSRLSFADSGLKSMTKVDIPSHAPFEGSRLGEANVDT